jgi:hypothetical protein
MSAIALPANLVFIGASPVIKFSGSLNGGVGRREATTILIHLGADPSPGSECEECDILIVSTQSVQNRQRKPVQHSGTKTFCLGPEYYDACVHLGQLLDPTGFDALVAGVQGPEPWKMYPQAATFPPPAPLSTHTVVKDWSTFLEVNNTTSSKYYEMRLLRDNTTGMHALFTRWGKIKDQKKVWHDAPTSKSGRNYERCFDVEDSTSLECAQELFRTKLKEKHDRNIEPYVKQTASYIMQLQLPQLDPTPQLSPSHHSSCPNTNLTPQHLPLATVSPKPTNEGAQRKRKAPEISQSTVTATKQLRSDSLAVVGAAGLLLLKHQAHKNDIGLKYAKFGADAEMRILLNTDMQKLMHQYCTLTAEMLAKPKLRAAIVAAECGMSVSQQANVVCQEKWGMSRHERHGVVCQEKWGMSSHERTDVLCQVKHKMSAWEHQSTLCQEKYNMSKSERKTQQIHEKLERNVAINKQHKDSAAEKRRLYGDNAELTAEESDAVRGYVVLTAALQRSSQLQALQVYTAAEVKDTTEKMEGAYANAYAFMERHGHGYVYKACPYNKNPFTNEGNRNTKKKMKHPLGATGVFKFAKEVATR